MSQCKVGVVGFFNELEGRGFIISRDNEKIYVHYSAIISNDEFKTLIKGQKVNFTLYPGDEFLQAKDVMVVGES